MCCFALAPTCSCIFESPCRVTGFRQEVGRADRSASLVGPTIAQAAGGAAYQPYRCVSFLGRAHTILSQDQGRFLVNDLDRGVPVVLPYAKKGDKKKGGANALTRLVTAVRDCDAVWSEFSPKIIRGWYIYFWNIALMLLRSLFGV